MLTVSNQKQQIKVFILEKYTYYDTFLSLPYLNSVFLWLLGKQTGLQATTPADSGTTYGVF